MMLNYHYPTRMYPRYILQNNLDKLGPWSNDIVLQIASNKCEILSTTGLRSNLPDYSINNFGLLYVNYFKDLGITFNSKSTFNMHMQ